MTPSDESNPFASNNPWPKMPSAPMRVGALPKAPPAPEPEVRAPTPAYVRPMTGGAPAAASPQATQQAAVAPRSTPAALPAQPEPAAPPPAPAWTPRAREAPAKPRGFSVAAIAATVAAVVGIGVLAVVLRQAPAGQPSPEGPAAVAAAPASPGVGPSEPALAAAEPALGQPAASAPTRIAVARRPSPSARPTAAPSAESPEGDPAMRTMDQVMPESAAQPPAAVVSPAPAAAPAVTPPPPTAAPRPPSDPDAPVTTRPMFSE